MKFSDTVWGVALVLFAGALFVHAGGFPTIPGQRIGPSALPRALALGLAVCGVLLFVRGRRAAATTRWIEWPEWFASRPQVVAFAVFVAVNLLYLLAVDRLGFLITGTIYLGALMQVLRVRARLAWPIAIVMTLLIHYCFYKLLRVPLPWGVLQSWAW